MAKVEKPRDRELLSVLALMFVCFAVGVFGLSVVYEKQTGESLPIIYQIGAFLVLCVLQTIWAAYDWQWSWRQQQQPAEAETETD